MFKVNNKDTRTTPTAFVVSGGKKMFVFRKIWRALFSCNTRFETRPFALLKVNSLFPFK